MISGFDQQMFRGSPPLPIYYDDFGDLVRNELAQEALRVFSEFTEIPKSDLGGDKSLWWGALQFLGLTVDPLPPQISNGAILNISLPEGKILLRATLIEEIIAKGSVQHKQLEELICKLSFTQTSVFGRFARTLLKPLNRKLHSRPYISALSSSEPNPLSWREASVRAARPRQVLLRRKFPEIVIYTDAATYAAILAAVVIDVQQFPNGESFASTFTEVADKDWETIANDTTAIYCLEMLAAIALISALMDFIQDKNVVFYVGNSNTKDALAKGHSDTRAIDIIIRIFWEFAQASGTWVWIEQAPSSRNISDLPTRNAPLPLPSKAESSFGILNILKELATKPHDASGFFVFMESHHQAGSGWMYPQQ